MNSEDVRLASIREVEREIAEFEKADAKVAAGLAQRRRRPASSTVFSLRLDAGEIDALECRAAAMGLKPSGQ